MKLSKKVKKANILIINYIIFIKKYKVKYIIILLLN